MNKLLKIDKLKNQMMKKIAIMMKRAIKIQILIAKKMNQMLTVDNILNLFYNKKSAKEVISICNERIAPIGLYPLPEAEYSLKYKLFRKLANNSRGVHILRMLLPNHTPEKR